MNTPNPHPDLATYVAAVFQREAEAAEKEEQTGLPIRDQKANAIEQREDIRRDNGDDQ